MAAHLGAEVPHYGEVAAAQGKSALQDERMKGESTHLVLREQRHLIRDDGGVKGLLVGGLRQVARAPALALRHALRTNSVK